MYSYKKQEKLNIFGVKRVIFNRLIINYLVLGLLLLAFILRVHNVTSIPMSLDEIITIKRYVHLPVVTIFNTIHSNNHPLASTLAHLFSPQATDLFMMRWPFIIVGLVALPFIYRLGVDLFGLKVGLLTLLLAGVTPIYIGYAVVVRGYGGLISLTVISFYFLWKAVTDNHWYQWLVFIIISSLIIFFHLFSLLAVGLMLALVGLGLIWNMRIASPAARKYFRPVWIRFTVTTLSLLAVYGLLIYTRMNSVLSEGGYTGEFEIWRDGISGFGDLAPFEIFINQMALMSVNGIAAYIYLILAGFGLLFLWTTRRLLAIATIIWFLAPFIIIFVAMHLFGRGFYAYVRFLLYLLPFYLLLVATGMVGIWDRLSLLVQNCQGYWRVTIGVLQWSMAIGMLILIVISLNWYIIRTSNTNWPAMAKFLSAQLQSEDIVICEEYQRDLAAPDRAKPYCIWMLDFFTELEEYTPRFQSTTDFIANYNHIQEQKDKMLASGGVWLVVWQKIVFNVEHLVTDEEPVVMPSPPLSAFAPHQAWQYGAATLVYVNSEETLLGNVYQAVEMLSKLENQPSAPKARYYRSLADMEAIQGHKDEAFQYLQSSWAMVEQTGGMYPELFLQDTQQVINRIPDNAPPPETAYPTGYKFGPSICLQAYEISPLLLAAGQPVHLSLYWQALDQVSEDYAFFLQFDDQANQVRHRLQFDPFDRIYPTPWWWSGQQLVERREFFVPVDMPAQNYIVQLGLYNPESPEGEMIYPLFYMLPQNGDGPGQWQIKTVNNSAVRCPYTR